MHKAPSDAFKLLINVTYVSIIGLQDEQLLF